MLPAGFSPTQVLFNDAPITFTTGTIEESAYLDAMLPGSGQLTIH
jgi:hypothetical protein